MWVVSFTLDPLTPRPLDPWHTALKGHRMGSRQGLKPVWVAIACLLLIAVVSYAAFPAKAPKQPIRVVFQSIAGKVMFSHDRHLSATGYAFQCDECHHTLAPGEFDRAGSCTACHPAGEGGDESVLSRADALHKQCIDCHLGYDKGPTECAQCHMMQ